jgi:hypothetical protein
MNLVIHRFLYSIICREGNFNGCGNLKRIRHPYYSRMYKMLQNHIKTIFRKVRFRANCFSAGK